MAYGPVNVPGVNHTDLDAVRTAAAAAQRAADAARAAAQNAQSTADAAGTAAQKAQQTADTARTDAGRAQTTADGAKTAAVVMGAATGSAAGKAGLVPAPGAGAQGKFLRGDGTWQTPPDTNTTYSAATQSAAGLMSAADKKKLDGVAAGANAYSLPVAAAGARGGVKIGYAANGKNYPVQLSNEQMYVNVPWTDTNTTYTPAGAAPKAAGTAAVGTSAKYAREDHVHPAQTSVSGNAGTATKLATACNITIGSATKAFDGSGPVNFTLAEIGASAPFVVQGTAPANTKVLWIDTTANTGGLKYHNGSAWVHVPVAYN